MNLLILALAPVLIILVYIYIRDKYEREPIVLLIGSLIVGAFIVIPVIFVESFFDNYSLRFSGYSQAAFTAFISAGLVEEFFKFIALYYLIWRNKEFNEKFDGIVYAVFISLGFAGTENILYVFEYGEPVAYTRAFTAVPAHALFGVIMGYYFSLSKFYPRKKQIHFIAALLVPVLLHGMYNYILMTQHKLYLLFFIPFLFYLWRSGFKKMKELAVR